MNAIFCMDFWKQNDEELTHHFPHFRAGSAVSLSPGSADRTKGPFWHEQGQLPHPAAFSLVGAALLIILYVNMAGMGRAVEEIKIGRKSQIDQQRVN